LKLQKSVINGPIQHLPIAVKLAFTYIQNTALCLVYTDDTGYCFLLAYRLVILLPADD